MNSKHHDSFTLPLGEARPIRHEAIAPRDDLVRAMRAIGEDDFRAMTLDWPDLDRAIHRAAQYTAGLLLPGRSNPLLVEVLLASYGSYRRAADDGHPEDVCSCRAAQAMARTLSIIVSQLEVCIHDGTAWRQWSPLKCHLADYLLASKAKRIRVDMLPAMEHVEGRYPFAGRLIIASRIFDLPLLERAGFLSNCDCDGGIETQQEALAG